MSYCYEFPRPSVTVDTVCLATADGDARILLIRRARDPYAGAWALPGGFLDLDEELATAARRELHEETAVELGGILEVGTFGAVDRDPRGRTLTVAFVGVHVGAPPAARAGDDASHVRWHPLRRLPRLAFDHKAIIARAMALLAARATQPDGLLELLPRRFTMAELRAAHELASGQRLDAATFGRWIHRAGIAGRTTTMRGRAPLYTRTRR